MIYAIVKILFTIGLNLFTIVSGFFLAKSVGLLFLSMMTIVMEEQESLKSLTKLVNKIKSNIYGILFINKLIKTNY